MQLKQQTNERDFYFKSRQKFCIYVIFGVIALVALFLYTITNGNYETSFVEVVNALLYPDDNKQVYTIVLYSRIPRFLAAITVGAALSAAGWIYQEVFSNRMVSPDVLGVSSGAGVGAALGFVLNYNIVVVGVMAFTSGILSVAIALLITILFGRGSNKTLALILSGIVVNGFMSSLLGLLKYISSDTQLTTITYWLLGGFYNISYKDLLIAVPVIIVCIILLYCMRWKIMMLKNGEIDAKMHGINYVGMRNIAIIGATIITAISVSISGTIGWIGLAIPNFIRIIVNDDEKYVLPLVILYGMIFTGISDFLARSITDTEIPIGIITGLIGAVIFIVVLTIRRKK